MSQFLSKCDASVMGDAAGVLMNGGLVAFPTETVYGLGADACNAAAVARIYSVKGRPADHPLIVHVASMDALGDWAADVPAYAIALARDYWPGPMTLVVMRSELAEDFITAKNDKNFKVLFERLRPGILNHCYLILKDQELAEDAFLNTMSKIWLKIDQYNSERGNFSTWCYNIARNESLLLMKSRKRYYSHTDSELEFLSSKNTIGDIGGQYNLEDDPTYAFYNEGSNLDEVYESVLDEIRDLPELYRDIMIDREINHMKYKDIAEKYGIKKRSIATRIRRARGKIRKKIDGKQ